MNMNSIKCEKKEPKNCFFRFDISRLLSKLNLLIENFDRLRNSINSVRYDISSLESKLKWIRSNISSVRHDIRDIEDFLLNHNIFSSECISMRNKCCLINLNRKMGNEK